MMDRGRDQGGRRRQPSSKRGEITSLPCARTDALPNPARCLGRAVSRAAQAEWWAEIARATSDRLARPTPEDMLRTVDRLVVQRGDARGT